MRLNWDVDRMLVIFSKAFLLVHIVFGVARLVSDLWKLLSELDLVLKEQC